MTKSYKVSFVTITTLHSCGNTYRDTYSLSLPPSTYNNYSNFTTNVTCLTSAATLLFTTQSFLPCRNVGYIQYQYLSMYFKSQNDSFLKNDRNYVQGICSWPYFVLLENLRHKQLRCPARHSFCRFSALCIKQRHLMQQCLPLLVSGM